MAVNFFNEDRNNLDSDLQSLTDWVRRICEFYRFELVELNYIFCSDEYLLQINNEYLQHDYYTDIITFDNSEREKTVEADLFISIDRIQENAAQQGAEIITEQHRVMIHGVLHLIGFSDKTDEDKIMMRKKEDHALSLR